MITTFEEDPGVVHYAVGDVHGCLTQLEAALAWCSEDAADAGLRGVVHLLGDYVDRGPDSRGVIDLLMRGPAEANMDWRPKRGNHDDMLARAWRDPGDPETAGWWEHGGQQTLASYGWNPVVHGLPSRVSDWVPREHAEWLATLPLAAETPFAIFVHAGLRPGIPLRSQAPRDLMWIRSDFLRSDHDFGVPVVHGHTPDSANPVVHPNRVALDSGCFMGGILAVAAFDPGDRRPRLERFGADGRIRPEQEGFDPPIC